jgi:hypothetical protein
VLTYAIIVKDGGALFTKNDMNFEITADSGVDKPPANLI